MDKKLSKRTLIWRSMLISVFSIFSISFSMAQDITVSGKVTSQDDGYGVPGVSILVTGTNKGTTTDLDGNYKIEVSEDAELAFSFVGYATQTIAVAGRSIINIVLETDISQLSEVVVIGYGTQSKKLVTGSTVGVAGEELEKMNSTNAFQALQGKTAGVNITPTSGQPGAGFEVNIRGIGTIGDANPLYIVDGFPIGDISYLNNADIESIDIIKDAAYAAIYGSRAANGVVQITTKQGSRGKEPQISFNSYYGVQQVRNKIELLNAEEYAVIMNEQSVNSGNLPIYSQAEINELGEGTNWLDEIFVDDAITQNYYVGITGGGENSIYSASGSYTQQQGVIGGADYSDYERYSFNLNSEYKLFDDVITIGEKITFSYIDQIGIADQGQYYNNIRGAFNVNPLIPVYDENGDFYDNSGGEFIDGGTQANPYAQLVYNNQREGGNQRLVGNLYAQARVFSDFTAKTNFSISHVTGQSRSYTPVYQLSIFSFQDTSSVSQSFSRDINWTWENTLRYDKTFGSHNLQVLAGHSAQRWSGTSMNATNANLSFNSLQYAYLGNTTYANGPRMSVGGGGYEDMLLSYFGRVLYDYKEKYLLTAVFRADGSAKFAKGNRWGYFPSVSGGWVVSNESFFSPSQTLSFLKLRAGWGQNGSNFIPGYRFLDVIGYSNNNYTFGTSEGSLTPGAYPYRLPNPNVKWETSEQATVGIDAELLSSKLNVTADYYYKTTKDWLIQAPVLATAGAQPPFINGGDVVNRGVELVLDWKDNVGDFSYNLSVNGAYNENKINKIPNQDGLIQEGANVLFNNAQQFYRAQDGFPIGYFWGYETLGVFQNVAEVQAYTNGEGEPIQKAAEPGDLIYADNNGDGKITAEDKTLIGDPNPDFTFGFTVGAEYKGFDISINANGAAGHQIVQSYRSVTDRYSNYTKDILNRWHGEGTSNTIPKLTENGKNFTEFSDLYVEDADFLRINNIVLGYNFTELINNDFFNNVRFYVSAQNLFTFTKYSGMDPEVGFGESFSRGVDLGYYPRPTTFLAGIDVKF